MQLPFECKPHKSFVNGYNTLGFLSMEEVIPLIGVEEFHTFKVDGHDVDIKLSAPRLLPFIKSVKCYNPYCSEVGFIFAVQKSARPAKAHGPDKSEYTKWHINLYSTTGRLMTCDHLIPQSAFGKSRPERHNTDNLGTLCCTCNQKKHRDSVDEFLEKQKHANLFTQEQQNKEPDLFEGQTVGEIINLLKKYPKSMKLAREKASGGFGAPAILSFEAKLFQHWSDSKKEDPKMRLFFGWNEL